MKITSQSFTDNGAIPAEFAFCAPDAKTHCTLGTNRNPHLAWSDVPAGTKSLVLLCHDPDVPSKPDDVNQEGRTIPASLPRIDFFHWVLTDLDPASGAIAAGEFSSAVFTLYALDVARCAVDGVFKGADVRAAMQGHVLAEAKMTGKYSLNPSVKA